MGHMKSQGWPMAKYNIIAQSISHDPNIKESWTYLHHHLPQFTVIVITQNFIPINETRIQLEYG